MSIGGNRRRRKELNTLTCTFYNKGSPRIQSALSRQHIPNGRRRTIDLMTTNLPSLGVPVLTFIPRLTKLGVYQY